MKKVIFAMIGVLTGLLGCARSGDYTTQGEAEFAKTIASPEVQLVDVRTSAEYAGEHIPGAVNMDVQSSDFDAQSSKLDKSRPVAVYCRSGMRSRTAAGRLAAQGFEVYNLRCGMMGWAGPVVEK